MFVDRIQQLRELIKRDPDNALYQYTLGLEYLKRGQAQEAVVPLRAAIALRSDYSAAYRELGKALTDSGLIDEALNVFQKGMEIAHEGGDIQTAREIHVFIKRLEKSRGR